MPSSAKYSSNCTSIEKVRKSEHFLSLPEIPLPPFIWVGIYVGSYLECHIEPDAPGSVVENQPDQRFHRYAQAETERRPLDAVQVVFGRKKSGNQAVAGGKQDVRQAPG